MNAAPELTGSGDVESDDAVEHVTSFDFSERPGHQNRNQPGPNPDFLSLRWLPICGIVVLAVIISLSILVVEVNAAPVAATLIGFLFVQILLAAVWTTLASVKLATRVISGTIFVLFLCLCMYRCAYRDGGGTSTAVAIAGAMFFQSLLYQIPLWYMRYRGWKLGSAMVPIINRREEVQFGIKHLLIWTTLVAMFMGLVQFAAPYMKIEASQLAEALRLGLNLTLGNSLIALPIIWGCLARYYFWPWIIVAIVVCFFVCFAQTFVSPGIQDGAFLWIINIAQTTISIAAMLALRLTGCRLQRELA